VAQLLFRTIVENARRNLLRALYLLTTTAEDYFAQRGISRMQREHVPETVKQSREFVDACPASAVAMGYALIES
jgi:amino-acid N-acetyltransferase